MLPSLNPSPLLVRQLLLASGIKDPKVFEVVNRVMQGGLSSPSITHIEGGDAVSIPLPEGSSCVRAAMDATTERMEVYIVVHKKILLL